VSRLVGKGGDIPDALVAVLVGRTDRLAALVKADPTQLTIRNEGGYSPLHVAAKEGNVRAARALIDAGAEVDMPDERRAVDTDKVVSFAETPLHVAVAAGRTEVARLLLDRGADVNARDFRKCTPLHQAAGDGNLELVRLLVARQADRSAQDEKGQMPLDHAREWRREAVVRVLEKPGAGK
jgi:ankyrin repeat protein